jgi:hypothetical protein
MVLGTVMIEDGNVKMEDCLFDNAKQFTLVVYIRGNEMDFIANGNTKTSLTAYNNENCDPKEYCKEGLVDDYYLYGMI